MKRWTTLVIVVILSILIASMCRTAIDPADFTGAWYSYEDQSVYLFQEGIIYCSKHSVPISATESISGAYTFAKDSIVLFAVDIDGLDAVTQLYLVKNGEECILSGDKNGTSKIYFVRENPVK